MPNFSLLGQTVWPPNLDTQTDTRTFFFNYILAEIPVSPGLGLRPRNDLQRPPRPDLTVFIYINLGILTTVIL